MLRLVATHGRWASEPYASGTERSCGCSPRSTSSRITPFAMQTGTQFRPAPPPALNSEVWTRDAYGGPRYYRGIAIVDDRQFA